VPTAASAMICSRPRRGEAQSRGDPRWRGRPFSRRLLCTAVSTTARHGFRANRAADSLPVLDQGGRSPARRAQTGVVHLLEWHADRSRAGGNQRRAVAGLRSQQLRPGTRGPAFSPAAMGRSGPRTFAIAPTAAARLGPGGRSITLYASRTGRPCRSSPDRQYGVGGCARCVRGRGSFRVSRCRVGARRRSQTCLRQPRSGPACW
jgi:hypothetical protein